MDTNDSTHPAPEAPSAEPRLGDILKGHQTSPETAVEADLVLAVEQPTAMKTH